ncbi:hypothetical protein GGR52DRAFT_575607 [Hypoxylon sp. FL1284]|nr:hypothetical protein GGR52DRAFT_575607 [Hypoxylon sp. FL1284]
MSETAVHVTLLNQTSERLVLDPSETTGRWANLPRTIPPASSASFQLLDAPAADARGTASFLVRTADAGRYAAGFRSAVPDASSPVRVHCALRYSTDRCRFALVGVAGRRESPVRDGLLDVTVRPLDPELVGAEVTVHGSVDGIRVLRTENVFVTSMDDVVVPARLIDWARRDGPFGKNVVVAWSMELRQPLRGVIAVEPYETRLDMCWLQANEPSDHHGYKNGPPIEPLTTVLTGS